MKRILLCVAVTLTAFPAYLSAQSVEEMLSFVPARSRDATAVIRWNADHSFETIREGDGPLVCYSRSGDPGRAAFAVQCTSKNNLERAAQSRRFQFEANGDRGAVGELVNAAEANGTRVPPEYGSLWINANGDDFGSARAHTTVAVPGATAESTGLPETPRGGGAWIMQAGTTSAHLMVPGN